MCKVTKKGFEGSALLALLAAAIVCGCSRTPPPDSKSNEFFANWLRGHGETNVVEDAQGVGLAGNATRLRWSLYGSNPAKDGTLTAELEFRIRMPEGREIVEYVAGSGDSLEKAEAQAKANFVITTFHVVYGGFMNTNDPHHAEEKVTIGGQPRVLVVGDSMIMGKLTNTSPTMFEIRNDIRKALEPLPLSPETHWIKVVYANHHSNTMMCAVTMDNKDAPELTQTIQKLPWPQQDPFYMAKQFILVK